MIKAKPINTTTWILYDKSTKIGLMNLNDIGYNIIGGDFAGAYETVELLNKKLGKVTFVKLKEVKEKKQLYIDDYPIKHTEIFNVVDGVGNTPSYTKTEGSTIRYAAGYYIVKVNEDWLKRYCPRVEYLKKYPNQGPFKTAHEMEYSAKMENKEK